MTFYSRFATYYDAIFPYNPTTYEFLKSFTDSNTQTVLDAGCGTGDMINSFAEDGFRSIGIDLNDEMIEVAKERHNEPEFHVLDLLQLDQLKQKFDLIYCIGNTAAHLTFFQFQSMLQKVSSLLNENGIWIFQVMNWDYILTQAEYKFPLIENEELGIRFTRIYPAVKLNRLQFLTRLESDKEVIFEASIPIYPVKSGDYINIHRDRSFECEGHYATFSKELYRPDVESANIFVFKINKSHD